MPSSILHPPSSFLLSVANRQRGQKINLRLLKQIAGELLVEMKIEKAELGINLVAAPQMTALNESFLQHEGSTDVITFDYAAGTGAGARAARLRGPEKEIRGRAARAPLYGEIFICMDEAMVQAKKFKSSWQSEIVRYLIHGVLHLLAYDDSRADERRKMKREENRLLRQFSRRFSLAQLAGTTKLPACTNR